MPINLDPFGSSDPIPTRRRRSSASQMTEEEQASLLSRLGSGTLAGLQVAGNIIDTPFSVVRGLAAGDPVAALTGIWDTSARKSGRDVLEAWNVAPENEEGFHPIDNPVDAFWDAAGFATEVAMTAPGLQFAKPVAGAFKGGSAIVKAATEAGELAVRSGMPEREAGQAMLRAAVDKFVDSTSNLANVDDLARGAIKRAPGVSRVKAKTPVGMAEEFAQGERELFSVKMPWWIRKTTGVEKVGTIKGGDKAADAIRSIFYGDNPLNPMPRIRQLFSHPTQGLQGSAAQLAADTAYEHKQQLMAALQDLAPFVGKRDSDLAELYGRLAEHAKASGDMTSYADFMSHIVEWPVPAGEGATAATRWMKAPEIAEHLKNVVRSAASGTDDAVPWAARVADRAIDAATPHEGIINQISEEMDDLLGNYTTIKDTAYARAQSLGLNGSWLDSLYEKHFPRRPSNKVWAKEFDQLKARLFPTGTPFASARTLKDLPGGRYMWNALSRDTDITAIKWLDEGAAAGADERVKRWLVEKLGKDPEALKGIAPDAMRAEYIFNRYISPAAAAHGVSDPEQLADLLKKSNELVGYFKKLPADVTKNGIFDRTTIADWFDYMEHLARAESNIRMIHHVLHPVTTLDDGDAPLARVWAAAGLNEEGLENFTRTWAKNNGHNLDEVAAVAGGAEEAASPVAELAKRLHVNNESARTITRYMKSMEPSEVGPIIKAFDQIKGLISGHLTLPFPSFHSRNEMGGVWQAWANNDVSLLEIAKGHLHAWKYWLSGGKHAIPYIDELRTLPVSGGQGRLVDVFTKDAADVGRLPEGGAGDFLDTFTKGWGKGGWKDKINPLRMPGVVDEQTAILGGAKSAWRKARGKAPDAVDDLVGGATAKARPFFLPGQAGMQMHRAVEFANNAGQYIALRNSGYTPSQALQEVVRAQFRGSELTPFEREFANRAIMWYGWTRKNIPYQFAKIASEPFTGRTSTTIRYLERMRGNQDGTGESYVPKYMREGTAARLGGTAKEALYLRGSGLPIEDLNKFIPGDMFRTAERFAAQLHPGLTVPIEHFSQKELYSGRARQNLEPLTDNPTLDEAIFTPPQSRYVNEIMRITDSRKPIWARALNMATGLKLTTVDEEKWRLIDTKDALTGIIEDNPYVRTYERPYIPKDKRERAGPEVDQQIDEVEALNAAIQKLVAERKRERDQKKAMLSGVN